MDFKNKYEEETKQKPYCWNESGQYVRSGSYSDGYVKWLEEQLRQHFVVGQSEQLVCDCGNSSMTWYGNDDDKKWFCFNCKKEAN